MCGCRVLPSSPQNDSPLPSLSNQLVHSSEVIHRHGVSQLLCLASRAQGTQADFGCKLQGPAEVRVVTEAGSFSKDSQWPWTRFIYRSPEPEQTVFMDASVLYFASRCLGFVLDFFSSILGL